MAVTSIAGPLWSDSCNCDKYQRRANREYKKLLRSKTRKSNTKGAIVKPQTINHSKRLFLFGIRSSRKPWQSGGRKAAKHRVSKTRLGIFKHNITKCYVP